MIKSDDIYDIEWSYVIQFSENCCIEIKKGKHLYPNFRYCIDLEDNQTARRERPNKELLSLFFNLLSDIYEIIEKNYSIKKVLERVKHHPSSRTVTNFYSQHLNSGKSIIELSEKILHIKQEDEGGVIHLGQSDKLLKTFESPKVLYISATIFFIMALEGFINALYEFLLMPDFKNTQFKKTIRNYSACF